MSRICQLAGGVLILEVERSLPNFLLDAWEMSISLSVSAVVLLLELIQWRNSLEKVLLVCGALVWHLAFPGSVLNRLKPAWNNAWAWNVCGFSSKGFLLFTHLSTHLVSEVWNLRVLAAWRVDGEGIGSDWGILAFSLDNVLKLLGSVLWVLLHLVPSPTSFLISDVALALLNLRRVGRRYLIRGSLLEGEISLVSGLLLFSLN